MPLETGTYISDLNASNPLGTGDPKAQGDDHLRLIKATIKNTFPNLNAAVNATPAQLNVLTGTTNDRVVRVTGGAVNLGQLTAGMFPSTVVPDAALSSNVPLKNAGNVFTGTQQVTDSAESTSAFWRVNNASGTRRLEMGYVGSSAGTVYGAAQGTAVINAGATALTISTSDTARIGISAAGAITLNGVDVTDFARLSQGNTFTGATQTISNASNPRINVSDGTIGGTMLAFTGNSLLIGSTTSHAVNFVTNSTAALTISASRNFDFKGGTVTTSNTSASEVGKTGAPSRNVTSSGNTAASDQGGCIRFTGGSGQTFTLDSDIPADCFVLLINQSGNAWTIAASGTLTFAGATGNRTLPNGSMAAAVSAGSGNYHISGQLT